MSDERLTVTYYTYFPSPNRQMSCSLLFLFKQIQTLFAYPPNRFSFLGFQRPMGMWEYFPCTAVLQNCKHVFYFSVTRKMSQQLGITVVFQS